LFWSSPKRPPQELEFDPANQHHTAFIVACACLRATIFGIPIPKDCRKMQEKIKLAKEASNFKVKQF